MAGRRQPPRARAILAAALLTLAGCVGPPPPFLSPPSSTPALPGSTPTLSVSASPASTPAATATPKPVPTPVAEADYIYHGDRVSHMVALTFDGAGRSEPAAQIIEQLRALGVPATVFLSGRWAEVNPNVARAVVDGGFELGNHSYDHPRMGALSPAAILLQLSRAESTLQRLTGANPRPWFRPPYGDRSDTLLRTCLGDGYTRVVMWDIDTLDWSEGSTAAMMRQRVMAKVQGGSIVLMHLGGYHTLEALPALVADLRASGYELVTLGTMLGK